MESLNPDLFSGSERHNSSSMITSGKGGAIQYPAYNSLPRPAHGTTHPGGPVNVPKGEVEVVNNQSINQQSVPLQREGSLRINSGASDNARGRMYLSLHRGPSSSSTSDNNSDATYTDSEPITRRGRGNPSLEGQNSKSNWIVGFLKNKLSFFFYS